MLGGVNKIEGNAYNITPYPRPEKAASSLLNKWCEHYFLHNLPLSTRSCSLKLNHKNETDYQYQLLDEADALIKELAANKNKSNAQGMMESLMRSNFLQSYG